MIMIAYCLRLLLSKFPFIRLQCLSPLGRPCGTGDRIRPTHLCVSYEATNRGVHQITSGERTHFCAFIANLLDLDEGYTAVGEVNYEEKDITKTDI